MSAGTEFRSGAPIRSNLLDPGVTGTRVTLSYDDKTVVATATFPDGTTDVLKLP